MKIFALTVGGPSVASTQYRLIQFIEPLKALGIELTLQEASTFSKFESLVKYDVVIIQKRLMRISWVKSVRKFAKCLIFDTDDAIWEPHHKPPFIWRRILLRRRLINIARQSDLCTTANQHLADYLSKIANAVEVIPMALNPNIWKPADQKVSTKLILGWAGAPHNLAYVEKILPVIKEIQKIRPNVELAIYSGVKPNWSDDINWTHFPFAPGTEPSVVGQFDIGLLPLPDDSFAAGKSPIKALQYAACKVPCVASPVGATKELVISEQTGFTATHAEEWKLALLHLIDNESDRKRMGEAAYDRFIKRHSNPSVCQQWIACLKNAIQVAKRKKL
jgi:glycosyltransferase involved in cell wall biosynthesis